MKIVIIGGVAAGAKAAAKARRLLPDAKIDIYTEDKTSEPHADMSRPFSVDVVSTELLGASQLIYFLLDGVKCVADVAAEAIPEKGKKINLCINMEKIHLFDVDTEETIIG